MKIKIIIIVLALGFMSSIFFASTPIANTGQKIKENELSQKYREFLKQARDIMLPKKREVFMQLTTDRERDIFIEEFWKKRKLQRRRKTRDNIRTLMLLRMTQVLELTEEQTTKIFPVFSRIEREKIEIHRRIGEQIRELRLILKDENPNQKEITNKADSIKKLRNLLKSKDEELETYLEENLTLIQRAKYLIFSADFYMDLRNKLERARIMKERFRKKK